MATRDECVQLAIAAGFSPDRAGQVCDVAGGESGYGSDTRCACQACCDASCSTGCGPYYHDAECSSQRMTGHCGVFQLDQSNPTFAPLISSGCAYDLGCSLRAMFQFTQGGQCFDHPNPWSPHFGFGSNYGGCEGSIDYGSLGATGGTVTTTGNTSSTQGKKCNCPTNAPVSIFGVCVGPVGTIPAVCNQPDANPQLGGKACAPWDITCMVNSLKDQLGQPFIRLGLLAIAMGFIFVGVNLLGKGQAGGTRVIEAGRQSGRRLARRAALAAA